MSMIKCNSFVLRQTAHSTFSHFSGTWEELETLVEYYFKDAKEGYKPGVLVVPIDLRSHIQIQDFYSSTIELENGERLHSKCEARRAGEEPFISNYTYGEKQRTDFAEVILYSHEVLGEEASTDAQWEIISINARVSAEHEPMHPVTMMRNHLGLTGGTKAEYTADEFANAIRYWQNKAQVEVA